MPRLAFVLALAALAGCSENNPASCEIESNHCIDSGSGSGSNHGCTSASDCSGATPACDTAKNGGTCVQCTAADKSACTGTTPLCDTAAETCHGCVVDTDCGAGGFCRPDGACAAPANIIHAISTGGSTDPATCGGTGTQCTLDTALIVARNSVSVLDAPPKNYIKLDDNGPYRSTNPTPKTNFVVDTDKSFGLVIDSRSSDLQPHVDGPIITVNSGKGVAIHGGTIEGATGDGNGSNGSGNAIACTADSVVTVQETTIKNSRLAAINATGCTLTVIQASIQDNTSSASSVGILATNSALTVARSRFSNNKGGGISAMGGHFFIVGNVFQVNGDPTSLFGGVVLNSNDNQNALNFNTFSGNKATTSIPTDVLCVVTNFTAKNNIIWETGASTAQIGGTCKHAYSVIGMLAVPGGVDGGNNVNADPKLNGDLSVRADSSAKGKADSSDLTGLAATDINGTKRVAPADIGAYVVPAQ